MLILASLSLLPDSKSDSISRLNSLAEKNWLLSTYSAIGNISYICNCFSWKEQRNYCSIFGLQFIFSSGFFRIMLLARQVIIINSRGILREFFYFLPEWSSTRMLQKNVLKHLRISGQYCHSEVEKKHLVLCLLLPKKILSTQCICAHISERLHCPKSDG
jgi:hypothetical protein